MFVDEDGAGDCPNCGKATGFRLVQNANVVWPRRWTGQSGAKPQPPYAGFRIYACLHCSETSMTLVFVEPRMMKIQDQMVVVDGPETERLVLPVRAPRELEGSAPSSVRSLYAEASVCENAGAMRGAGVLYRAAVEELVSHQGAEGRTLYDRIESLKGKLSDELVTDLHEARMLGNDSIHDGLTYSSEEVADVASLIEEAVLVLYVQPEQKKAMREARRARRTSPPES